MSLEPFTFLLILFYVSLIKGHRNAESFKNIFIDITDKPCHFCHGSGSGNCTFYPCRPRMVRLEERLDKLEVKMDARFDGVQNQFLSMQNQFDNIQVQFNSTQKQFDQLYTLFYWGFGIIIMLVIFNMGYTMWDRRTALKPAIDKADDADIKSTNLIRALRDYSKDLLI